MPKAMITVVVSPAAICQQKIDEPPDHYVYLLQDDMKVKSIPLQSRPSVRFSVKTEQEFEHFLVRGACDASWITDGLPEAIRKPILQVRHDPAINNVRQRMLDAVGDRVHLFVDRLPPEIAEVPMDVQERRQTVHTGGFPACLRKYYADDPGVLQTALELWEAEDPKEAISKVKQRLAVTH